MLSMSIVKVTSKYMSTSTLYLTLQLRILFFSAQNQDINYLRIGDPAHRLLVKNLHSKSFLNQLDLCAHGVYTEQLEELSSTLHDYIDREESGDTDSYSASVQPQRLYSWQSSSITRTVLRRENLFSVSDYYCIICNKTTAYI